ncbi:hypothetical protein ACLK1T_22675 [Escherichia coli]
MSGEKKAKGWRFYGCRFWRNSTAFRWRLGRCKMLAVGQKRCRRWWCTALGKSIAMSWTSSLQRLSEPASQHFSPFRFSTMFK